MKRYNDIVVGSGISGLTLALLLARNNRSVLLLEKAPHIGGSLIRFYKEGIPFDTGFHFTGGFSRGGVLSDMLAVLDMRERIRPVFLNQPGSSCFVFEGEGVFDMPSGTDNFRRALQAHFPSERAAIDTYFSLVAKVLRATVAMDLRTIALSPEPIDEDFISLQQVLDSLTANATLKGLLSVYCLCYGTNPREVSFANHARVAAGLYESVARIEHGGEAFIRAFRDAFTSLNIDILCNTAIAECVSSGSDTVSSFVLDNGQAVEADDCIFTIHPHEIIKVLPQKFLRKAFVDRVTSFETSNGFFCTFGVVDGAQPADFGPSIASLLPSTDLNALLDKSFKGPGALAVIRSVEEHQGKQHCVVTAFEPSHYRAVEQWADSSVGKRPAGYLQYKEEKTEQIRKRVCALYPEQAAGLRMVDAATVLTFRDYLFSPEGNAYGIKQKISQFNLFGKLPLRNIYAAGQSAVLPGIVGAMMSSFVVARSIVGKENFNEFISHRLCPSSVLS